MQEVPSAELKKLFLHRRGRRHGELTEWRMQGISQAMSATRDRAVIEAKRTMVQVIAQLLRMLLEGIATLDRKMRRRRSLIGISLFSSRCRELGQP